jgi:hypothetical protein
MVPFILKFLLASCSDQIPEAVSNPFKLLFAAVQKKEGITSRFFYVSNSPSW